MPTFSRRNRSKVPRTDEEIVIVGERHASVGFDQWPHVKAAASYQGAQYAQYVSAIRDLEFGDKIGEGHQRREAAAQLGIVRRHKFLYFNRYGMKGSRPKRV
jgi:hypothetical protein